MTGSYDCMAMQSWAPRAAAFFASPVSSEIDFPGSYIRPFSLRALMRIDPSPDTSG